jgi:hypothetical protein
VVAVGVAEHMRVSIKEYYSTHSLNYLMISSTYRR